MAIAPERHRPRESTDEGPHRRFKLLINMGNAAMLTPEDVGTAVIRCGSTIRENGTYENGIILDENGNYVGNWRFE